MSQIDLTPFDPLALHGLLEGMSALLAIAISVAAWEAWSTAIRSALNATFAVGMFMVAAGDMTHAIFSASTTNPEVWVPWSATATRIVLLAYLTTGAVWATTRRMPTAVFSWLFAIGATALIVALIPAVLTFPMVVDMPLLGRPVDFVLALWWCGLWYTYSRHHGDVIEAQLPFGFVWVLALGALTHFVMALSHDLLDAPFLASHVLRVVQYSVWVFAVVMVGGRDAAAHGSLYELARSRAAGKEAAEILERLRA